MRKRLPIRRVLLVPGLFEPRWLLLPMKLALGRQDRTVEIWRDHLACRSLEQSVDRLRIAIMQQQDTDGSIGIVTHSFGDWVVRQAVAGLPQHSIEAIVSVTPVVTASSFGKLLHRLVGDRVSEASVMADSSFAAQNIAMDVSIRRLVIWAAFDLFVKRIDLPSTENLDVHRCLATHLSTVVQPNVHRLIRDFFDLVPVDVAETAVEANGYPATAWQPAISRNTKLLATNDGDEDREGMVLVNREGHSLESSSSLDQHFEFLRSRCLPRGVQART